MNQFTAGFIMVSKWITVILPYVLSVLEKKKFKTTRAFIVRTNCPPQRPLLDNASLWTVLLTVCFYSKLVPNSLYTENSNNVNKTNNQWKQNETVLESKYKCYGKNKKSETARSLFNSSPNYTDMVEWTHTHPVLPCPLSLSYVGVSKALFVLDTWQEVVTS